MMILSGSGCSSTKGLVSPTLLGPIIVEEPLVDPFVPLMGPLILLAKFFIVSILSPFAKRVATSLGV